MSRAASNALEFAINRFVDLPHSGELLYLSASNAPEHWDHQWRADTSELTASADRPTAIL